MSQLGYLLKPHEAQALRECSKVDYAPLNIFLHEDHPRIFLGGVYGSNRELPPFRFVVRKGKCERSDWATIQREKLGLWPERYFRIGPHCRACGERIQDGEKAIGFAFAPDRRPEYWRAAYLHAEPCVILDTHGKE